MKKDEAHRILRALLNAADPATGEALPEEHILNRPEVRSALTEALKAMGADGAPPASPPPRLKAGRPWTQADLDTLRQLYESGVSVEEIARQTHRHDRGVRMQLNLMAGGGTKAGDRVDIPDVIQTGSLSAMAPPQPRHGPVNSHRPWTAEADAELTRQFQAGQDPAELAVVLGRSAYAIEMRLQKLGFISADAADAPVRPWGKDDIAELRLLHSNGLSIPDIAARLKRSEHAISARLLDMAQYSHTPETDSSEAHKTFNPAAEEPAPLPEKASAPPSVPPEASPAVSPSRPWTAEDDTYLRHAWAEGITIGDMCTRLGRQDRLVRCRLIYLGVTDHSLLGMPSQPPELAHQGLPWYPEDVSALYHLFRQGRTPEQMAAALLRSTGSVINRLEMLGLTTD